ncbi:MAG TPA: amino acid adenylation domain-containing protein, partial [Candidatus Kapabacteria bacterium]|nr:amino acid adenylation domain-containing protein [Candidatus Kapabacteria bacterium]
EIAEVNIPGLKLSPYPYENKTAKFDLTLTAFEGEEKLLFNFEYCTKLFKAETVNRFITYFKNIVNGIIENKDRRIADFEIITEEEKKKILFDFNDTETQYPKDKTIHQLFTEQTEKSPDRIAVVGGTAVETLRATSLQITYFELNEQSDHMAGLLIEKGVLADTIVAIMMERSVEMIIGIFGILKSGGAYLPIDPDYPQERIDYMLKDSKAKILITNKSEIRNPKLESPRRGLQHSNFSNLAYVIYTSGSTGKPKGVMIEHCSLVNRLNWMQKAYPLDKRDTILQKTTFTFDVSVWEIFWWSIVGARLCLLPPGGEKDPEQITLAIERNYITTMHFVPSMLSVFLDYLKESNQTKKMSTLKWVIASGEALLPVHVERFNELLTRKNDVLLVNLYGPTEATIDVSYFNCLQKNEREIIPIGKPIDNINLYILDKNFHYQPIGVVGELYIFGAGLARGYLNNPELTAIKFISVSSVAKIYKTGDLAKWLPDGNIEFLGRIDHQVKIRG